MILRALLRLFGQSEQEEESNFKGLTSAFDAHETRMSDLEVRQRRQEARLAAIRHKRDVLSRRESRHGGA